MRKEYLGIKLNKAENKALLRLATLQGVPKSIIARHVLRIELIQHGVLTVTNPAPQADEVTQGIR